MSVKGRRISSLVVVFLAMLAGIGLASVGSSGSPEHAQEARAFSACPPEALPEREATAHNRNARSNDVTVPAGASRLQLCRYHGLNRGPQSSKLASERRLGKRGLVRSIGRQLNLPPQPPRGGLRCELPSDAVIRCHYRDLKPGERPLGCSRGNTNACPFSSGNTASCPMDDGSVIYANFGYSNQPDVPVVVKLSGCGGAWNGRTPRASDPRPRFLDQLKRLTAYSPEFG
jgi:hypothetical protein